MSGLILFALGFAGAIAVCACGISAKWIVLIMAAGGVLLLVSLLLRKKITVTGMAAVVFAGIVAACGWYLLFRQFYLSAAVAMDGNTQIVTLEASDYSYPTNYGSCVECYVILDGKPYRVRAYLDEDKQLAPGDWIVGSFRFRLTTPGGREEATYHPGKGIFLLAYQEDEVGYAFRNDSSLRHFPARLRAQIKGRLSLLFPEDVSAFTRALLLGDSSELSYETETAFRLSGIRHIIAVSGLHVSILYGFLSTITLKRRYLTAMIGLPALLLFAAVAGFTPSVTRACIMIGLMILSIAMNREYDPPTALGFATVSMLLCNPLTVTSAGWQLSVASVAGIFLFQKPIHAWIMSFLEKILPGKLSNTIASSISVSLGAMILTTPLSAYYFGAVSLVSVLTNLLTLWIVSFIFYGIMAVCLLSLVWQVGAALLAEIVAWPVRYVLGVSGFLADFPLASVYTRSPYIVVWLVFFYVLLGVFFLNKKKRTGIFACCAVTGLCITLLAGWVEPMLDECRVTVLDVGQGQSILFQSEGRTYLVDCGGDRDNETADIIAETLLSQGINRLDGILITHYDRDHSGALENLLTRIDTDLILLPGVDAEQADMNLWEMTDGTVVFVTEDICLSYGGVKITVIPPPFDMESNENSLCILFQRENCDILITGDRSGFGERQLMRHMDLPQVDLLIVGHHGSKYSTCAELLAEVMPETAVISAGENNPYGHPAQEVLDRLTAIGCEVYRTDLNGTVIFRR